MLSALDVRQHLCKLDWKVGVHRKRVVMVDNAFKDVDGIPLGNRRRNTKIHIGVLENCDETILDGLHALWGVHTGTNDSDDGKVVAACS